MTTMETLTYTREDNVAWVRMGKPQAMTLMTVELMRDLRAALSLAAADPDIRVLVIIGEGPAFVAGAHLGFVRDATSDQFAEFNRENQSLAAEMLAFTRPIIGGVNGHALGGGLEIALACDLRVCSASARLGFPEVSVALLHSTGSSYLLPRLIGLGRAKELTLTGRLVDPVEALSIGLVTQVVASDTLEEAVTAMATSIAHHAPVAVAWAKHIFDVGARIDVASALAIEAIGNRACFDTEDRHEGAQAFFEKRPPVYHGR